MEVDKEHVKCDRWPPESSTSRASCQEAVFPDTARLVSRQNGGKFVSHSQLWIQTPLSSMWHEINKLRVALRRHCTFTRDVCLLSR